MDSTNTADTPNSWYSLVDRITMVSVGMKTYNIIDSENSTSVLKHS